MSFPENFLYFDLVRGTPNIILMPSKVQIGRVQMTKFYRCFYNKNLRTPPLPHLLNHCMNQYSPVPRAARVARLLGITLRVARAQHTDICIRRHRNCHTIWGICNCIFNLNVKRASIRVKLNSLDVYTLSKGTTKSISKTTALGIKE